MSAKFSDERFFCNPGGATVSSQGREPLEKFQYVLDVAPEGRVSRSGSGLSLPSEEMVRR
jgi:hypothetical protein